MRRRTIPGLGAGALAAAFLPLPNVGTAAETPVTSPWKPSAAVSLKESYDSNVFLQDVGSLADRDSFVTTVIPSVGLKYQGGPAFQASLTYAPEVNFFHSESNEDYVLHRVGLNLGGKASATSWDFQNTVIAIDGDDEGLVFDGPGGAPAAGGPGDRDRRDAAIYRGLFKVTHEWNDWFVRPTATAYVHDWQTRHLSTPGYLNFVDRNEFTGGVDIGRKVSNGLKASVGYRYGTQDQAKLLSYPEEYDNDFHRLLFGIDGQPWNWLRLGVTLGPEFRSYGSKVPAGFGDHDVVNLFVDASLTFIPSKQDTVTVSVKQYDQPAFGGRAAYEDLTYNLAWRHPFGSKVVVGAGGRAYNTYFLRPAARNDWVFSGNALLSYAFTPDVQAELSYLYEEGDSRIPNTSGRDYTRHVVALGVRYTWK